jgi:translation initiation factor IF-2
VSIKIRELAKELDLPAEDVMVKAAAMGIQADSPSSAIEDIDALTVRNAIIHGSKAVETKIVKVAPKTDKAKQAPEEGSRVVVKAVTKAAGHGAKAKAGAASGTGAAQGRQEAKAAKQGQGDVKRQREPLAAEDAPSPGIKAESSRIPGGKPDSSRIPGARAEGPKGDKKPPEHKRPLPAIGGSAAGSVQRIPKAVLEGGSDEAPAARADGGEAAPDAPTSAAVEPAAARAEAAPAKKEDEGQGVGKTEAVAVAAEGAPSAAPSGGAAAAAPAEGSGGEPPKKEEPAAQDKKDEDDGVYVKILKKADPNEVIAVTDRRDRYGRPRDDRPRDDRPRGDRPPRDGWKDQRRGEAGAGAPRGDRPRDDRPRDDRPPRDGWRDQRRGEGGTGRAWEPRPGEGRQGEGRPWRPPGEGRQGEGRPWRPPGEGRQGEYRPGARPQGDRDGRGAGADGRYPPRSGDARGGRPGEYRPGARPQGDRPARPGDSGAARPKEGGAPKPPRPATKDFGKKKDVKTDVRKPVTDKDRDKYSGFKRKDGYVERSLEKRPVKSRNRPKAVKPVNEEKETLMNLAPGTKVINVPITVAGFAEQTERSTSEVIMKLMRLGIMANINQNIDEDTALVLAEELGVSVVIGNVEADLVEEGLELFEDSEDDLEDRPPIITVMGHVDHGKTSLLDAIRKTNVTQGEAGGITQHIGASEVVINGERIVFLDTPGHEAFTAMRARGAHVTDIAVLVVAADDGVKPQTIESISHAKAAGVPLIVAINKIDKPGANLDKVKQELADNGVLVEEWGGQTISVPVSAKSGEGIVNLLEMILLQSEVLELRANPDRLAMGTVIEARLDKAKGPVATLLVLNGTLESGMSVVAGTSSGRVRAMTDFQGKAIKSAGPATAVEILGLTEVPEAGDEFNAVRDDKLAREIAQNRRNKLREEVMVKNSSTTLEKLFSQIQEGVVKELPLIIKGDVQGSVGAITASLEKLKNENVVVKIVHTGVGTVTESDVMLASTAGAIIIAFNVRPSTAVSGMAEREGVEIRTYRIIYEVIDEVEAAMKGMLDPVFKENVLGKAEIRSIFKVPGVGAVAGCYITDGKVQRNAEIRLVRDGIVVHEGKIASLRRFKDDVREVAQGYECGIGIENYNDVKEGDEIEAFVMEEVKRN